MPAYPFKYFNKNVSGRDFVVGDIHGMFSLLESQLDTLNFDPEIDRVFAVGDLIDRGPESHRVLEFLNKPWFHSIKGNHEMMLIEAKHKKTHYRSWVKKNGGEWWEDVDAHTQIEIRERISELAVTFEIDTAMGKVGVVHADVPLGLSWPEIIHGIHVDQEIRDYMLWSRNRYKCIQRTGETVDVKGIDLIILGHTPISKPLSINNLYYIDTGASYSHSEDLGHLTILQIHPKTEVFQYPQPL